MRELNFNNVKKVNIAGKEYVVSLNSFDSYKLVTAKKQEILREYRRIQVKNKEDLQISDLETLIYLVKDMTNIILGPDSFDQIWFDAGRDVNNLAKLVEYLSDVVTDTKGGVVNEYIDR